MKADIHPQVFKEAKVTCTSCKAVFTIPSTKKENQIEICSNCHPVYTGKYRDISSSGRVERFRKRMAKKEDAMSKPKKRKITPEEKVEKKAKKASASAKASAEKKAAKKKSTSAKATADKKATRSTSSGQATGKKKK